MEDITDLATLTHDDITCFVANAGDGVKTAFIEALLQEDREKALRIYNLYRQRVNEMIQNIIICHNYK